MKITNYINHIAFCVDSSSSMNGLTKDVIQMFDEQIEYLARRSKDLDQETRVSVYLFGSTVECLVFDKDVLRLPSLKSYYNPNGMTALIDATLQSIQDLKQTAQIYGDHSFLVYVLTDGQENKSSNSVSSLSKTIDTLPDNWSIAVLVPDKRCAEEARRFGFPSANVEEWSVGTTGVKEVSKKLQAATDSYFTARAAGIRGTKTLFKIEPALSKTDVSKNLEELKTSEYEVLPVRKESPIKEYVESFLGEYRVGSAFYQLTKKETIQPSKYVLIKNKKNGRVYSGDKARQMIGLPSSEIKVTPGDFGEWNLFIQSSSVNRKLVANTELIILK